MSENLVKKLSNRECFTVNEDDNVANVINILTRNKIGALPVLDSNKNLVGIVSERDIIQKISLEKNNTFYTSDYHEFKLLLLLIRVNSN